MFNGSNCMTPADIAAVSGNNNGIFGDGAWWIIILLIFCFGGWGNGWGNGSGGMGVADNYVLASDFATIQRQIDSSADRLSQQSTSIANGLCDGFYTQAQLVNGVNANISSSTNSILSQMNNNAVNAMQDTFGIQTSINGVNVNANTNTQTLLAAIAANEANRQACCCETNNAIATNFGNLKYDMAAQDCQIRQTVNDVGRNLADVQNANTQAILSAIQKISDDAKDEKIANLQSQLTQMQNVADNAAQTAALQHAISNAVCELQPKAPVPSFTVPNPYAPYYTGCNCGCGIS